MIKKIYTEDNYSHRHIDDVVRIKKVMFENGYECDLPDAAGIWEDYSDSMAAGWMFLPYYDDELWIMIECSVEERCE